MSAGIDVLIFAEDPGAANFVADIPRALAETGTTARICATGLAVGYFSHRNISFDFVESEASPRDILRSYSPRILLCGTSDNRSSLGLKLIDECRSHSISTVGVIDLSVNANFRFCGETSLPLKYAPDFLFVPDKMTKVIFEEIGFQRDRIFNSGHPHFDKVRELANQFRVENVCENRARMLPGFSDGMRVIVFLAEAANRLDPTQTIKSPDYTLHGSGTSEFRTQIVLEEVLEALSELSKLFFVVRLHPKNSLSEVERYRTRIDFISSGGDPLDVIACADLVIGMSTMLLLESYLMGKDTLSVLPTLSEKVLLPNTAAGLTQVATTPAELRGYLRNWDAGLTISPIDHEMQDECFPPGALGRVVAQVNELVERHSKR